MDEGHKTALAFLGIFAFLGLTLFFQADISDLVSELDQNNAQNSDSPADNEQNTAATAEASTEYTDTFEGELGSEYVFDIETVSIERQDSRNGRLYYRSELNFELTEFGEQVLQASNDEEVRDLVQERFEKYPEREGFEEDLINDVEAVNDNRIEDIPGEALTGNLESVADSESADVEIVVSFEQGERPEIKWGSFSTVWTMDVGTQTVSNDIFIPTNSGVVQTNEAGVVQLGAISESISAPSVGGEWSHVKPAGAEGGYDYFFNTSTTPYGTTYGGNSSVQYTDDGFFVMKYQASNDGSDVPVSDGSEGWNDIAFNDAGGSPNAYDACEALDSRTTQYDVHLMTNREWMVVARQAAQKPENWADGSVGSAGSSGGLYQGNYDQGDSYDRAVDLGGSPMAAGAGGGVERTHNLSSGDQIWDMSGDLWHMVDADEDGTKMDGDSGSKIYERNALNSTVSGGDGLGVDYGFDVDNTDAASRGGTWASIDSTGVFQASSSSPDTSLSNTGFRCSAVPVN